MTDITEQILVYALMSIQAAPILPLQLLMGRGNPLQDGGSLNEDGPHKLLWLMFQWWIF